MPAARHVDPTRRRGRLFRAYGRIFGTTRPAMWFARTVLWKLDPLLLRLSGGRLSLAVGLPTALLETRGARTGQPRRHGVIYFHDATAWGIQSVAIGGPPWPVPGDSDIVNETCRRLHAHESYDELLSQVSLAHARLMHAARSSPDLDKPCFLRANGEALTGAQRLDLLARHWREHVHELEKAAKK